ncbi:MAG: hypothetical protein ABR586_01285 [Thermoplasmatota archaeon]
MAADTHVLGRIVLAAGKSVTQVRTVIAMMDSEIAKNAAGSEPLYLIPKGANKEHYMPRNDGQPFPIMSGPHVFPGELLLLGVIPSSANTAADVDTTGAASDAYHIEYVDYDADARTRVPDKIVDETTRCTTSGLAPATDPKLNAGSLTYTHAWGPMPPRVNRTIIGRILVDLRSAT